MILRVLKVCLLNRYVDLGGSLFGTLLKQFVAVHATNGHPTLISMTIAHIDCKQSPFNALAKLLALTHLTNLKLPTCLLSPHHCLAFLKSF
jgi:hypothetical protein